MYQVQAIVFFSVFSVFVHHSVIGFPYDFFQPKAILVPVPKWKSNPKVVTIKPLDVKAMRRSSYKLPPINPDAEPIFKSKNADKYPFDQVMERSSMSGVYYANKPKSNKKKNKFNMLNFDAYLVKPMNFSYKKVFATLKPGTERILKYLNQTTSSEVDEKDEKDEAKSKSGKHRSSKKRQKENRKSQGVRDMLAEFEQDQQRAASPWLYSNNNNKRNVLNSSLPIGMAYFDTLNHKNLRAQATFSPLPINYPFRRSMDQSDPSPAMEIKNRAFHLTHLEPAAQQSTQNDVTVHSGYTSFTDDYANQAEDFYPEEDRHSAVFEVMPEMYKFTLEDAVRDVPSGEGSYGGDVGVDGNRDGNRIRSFQGPVTEAPPDSSEYSNALNTRTVEEYVNPVAYQPLDVEEPTADYPINTEVNQYAANNQIYNHVSAAMYEPRHMPDQPVRQTFHDYGQMGYANPIAASSRVVTRELRMHNPKPTTITSETAVTEDNPNSDIITRSPKTFEISSWASTQLKFQSKKTEKKDLPKNLEKLNEMKSKSDVKRNTRKARLSNLEVTGSYSKQRTQGAVDAEKSLKLNESEPMASVAKVVDDEAGDYLKEQSAVATNNMPKQVQRRPKEENYFQYTNVPAKDIYEAGVGKGNDNHYIEQHERAVGPLGSFRKRVRWNDIKGGFGEQFYDLNHNLPQ